MVLDDIKKRKFLIDLIINSTEYGQTGEYSCVYSDDERSFIEEFYSAIDRMYLFVYGKFTWLKTQYIRNTLISI